MSTHDMVIEKKEKNQNFLVKINVWCYSVLSDQCLLILHTNMRPNMRTYIQTCAQLWLRSACAFVESDLSSRHHSDSQVSNFFRQVGEIQI